MLPNEIIKPKIINNRSLRIANEIKAILTDIFFKSKVQDPLLFDKTVIITDVMISKDLSTAKVFVSPWLDIDDNLIKILNKNASFFRHQIGKKLRLKLIPRLHFKLDTQFDKIDKINKLFKQL